jgi:hypothetical protein
MAARQAPTNITHVKAHKRDNITRKHNDTVSGLSEEEKHQEYNRKADHMAKASLSQDSSSIPDEIRHLPLITVLATKAHDGSGPQYVVENNPTKLYQKRYAETLQNYHFTGQWHTYLFDHSIWQTPSLSVLH